MEAVPIKEHTFYIVDVFAEKKYTGNQLAVFTDARTLSDPEMQNIAREMNYSETTFIMSGGTPDNGYDVRIFTPEEEVPFAGHPVLGTAYVIQKEILKEPADKMILNLKTGRIPVTFNSEKNNNILWMKQISPSFGQTFGPDEAARMLNINTDEIDQRFPVQDVSTGLPVIIVPLKTLAAVKKAKLVNDRYFKLIQDTRAKAVLIFCPETCSSDNDLNVRVFAEYYGIPEDPATGSANGCLAAYLVKHGYFGNNRIDIRVEQGHEIKRPSLLYLKAGVKGGEIDVHVGGKVVMVARGEFV